MALGWRDGGKRSALSPIRRHEHVRDEVQESQWRPRLGIDPRREAAHRESAGRVTDTGGQAACSADPGSYPDRHAMPSRLPAIYTPSGRNLPEVTVRNDLLQGRVFLFDSS